MAAHPADVAWLLSGRGDRHNAPWRLLNCAPDTRPDERAIVYERHLGAGIVCAFDFRSKPMQRTIDFGPNEGAPYWVAWGVAEPLPQPVSRAELVADPALRPVFDRPSQTARLPESVAARIEELVSLPPFRAHTLVPPAEDATAIAPLASDHWANEKALEDALERDEDAWQQLGFSKQPRRQLRSPDGRFRFDLLQDEDAGVLVECKLFGTLSDLENQLDPYLLERRASRGDIEWVGHVVCAGGFDRQLAAAVQRRDDVRLWVCHRRVDGGPFLQEITDPDDEAWVHGPRGTAVLGVTDTLHDIEDAWTAMLGIAQIIGVDPSALPRITADDHTADNGDLDFEELEPAQQLEFLLRHVYLAFENVQDDVLALGRLASGERLSEPPALDDLIAEPSDSPGDARANVVETLAQEAIGLHGVIEGVALLGACAGVPGARLGELLEILDADEDLADGEPDLEDAESLIADVVSAVRLIEDCSAALTDRLGVSEDELAALDQRLAQEAQG